MSISIIISESQKRMILTESFSEDFGDTLKKNYQFVKKVIKEAQNQIGSNLEFLLSWGATIGGLVRPINDFIQGKFPELSDIDLSLIITGVIATYYIDNKKILKEIYKKIVDRGLDKEMETTLNKSDSLISVFVPFIKSLGVTLHKVTNILSYAFIIPILPILYQIASQGDVNNSDFYEIVKRIGAFGIVTISGIVMRELIMKLLKRFKRN